MGKGGSYVRKPENADQLPYGIQTRKISTESDQIAISKCFLKGW
jgi:hypothetical protein